MDHRQARQSSQARKILIMSVLVHALLFLGVMDVYFMSPVEEGLTNHKSSAEPPSKRVVVFVADGLRAEAIFAFFHEDRAPFLNDIRFMSGAWGISHTQVPTESRPGHVAIFAGMYEDPSAITRGWKNNPIDFDHIFNQSQNSWLWGSPDVVPMFNKHELSKIHIDCYSDQLEDFSGRSMTVLLDEWVFDRVERFINGLDSEDCGVACKDQNIFFLHLLGLDTAGHVFKPNSVPYITNIRYVDERVKDTVDLFEKFFTDNSTTYLFTSDHGMTDWGSHGSGSSYETESPFIAWGAGIKMSPFKQDIKQADITPLIASLLGINIPINNVGIVPAKYIDADFGDLARIIFANVKQLGEQYNVKRLRMAKNTFNMFHQPFLKLAGDHYDHYIKVIDYAIQIGKYEEAIGHSHKLTELIEEGMAYYKFYYKLPTLACLAIGLLLWLVLVGMSITTNHEEIADYREMSHTFVSRHTINQFLRVDISCLFIIFSVFYSQGMEFKYYLYLLFPHLVAGRIIVDLNQLMYILTLICNYGIRKFVGLCLLYFVGIEVLVVTFYHREAISVVIICIILWVCFQRPRVLFYDKYVFTFVGLLMCLFPFFPTNAGSWSFIPTGLASFIHFFFLMSAFAHEVARFRRHRRSAMFLHVILLFMNCLCAGISFSMTILAVTTPTRSALYLHYFSWLMLGSCLFLLFFTPSHMVIRLYFVNSALYIMHSLMSFSYEGMLLFLFMYLMTEWILVEFARLGHREMDVEDINYNNPPATVTQGMHDDFRRSFFYVSFILLAYFGCGNIANLNSFDPMWVRCFISVFSPFTMASLIILKITIPFLLITIYFKSINMLTSRGIGNGFAIVLMICGVMTFNFMFLIENEGSWLEIGLSVSRFVIVILMTVVLIFFYGIAHIITNSPIYDLIHRRFIAPRIPDYIENIY